MLKEFMCDLQDRSYSSIRNPFTLIFRLSAYFFFVIPKDMLLNVSLIFFFPLRSSFKFNHAADF